MYRPRNPRARQSLVVSREGSSYQMLLSYVFFCRGGDGFWKNITLRHLFVSQDDFLGENKSVDEGQTPPSKFQTLFNNKNLLHLVIFDVFNFFSFPPYLTKIKSVSNCP